VEGEGGGIYSVDICEDQAAPCHDFQQPFLAPEPKHLGCVLVETGAVYQGQRCAPQRRPEMHQGGVIHLLRTGLPEEQQSIPAGKEAAR
jgi:hypothetical protein